MGYPTDVIVIGAGLSGLMAGWRVAGAGTTVRVISKGWGSTHWHSGCIDVLGYADQTASVPCASPVNCIGELLHAKPEHPYGLITVQEMKVALRALQLLCQEAGYPLHGSLDKNWLLPSAVGAMRPTCLAPETMIAGDLGNTEPMLIIGLKELSDSFAGLAADNLTAQGIPAQAISVSLKSLRQRRLLTAPILATQLESGDLAEEMADLIRPHIGEACRIGFPAVLGLDKPIAVKARLEAQLERPVFEIPMVPPSVPGMRLHRILKRAISDLGGQVFDGMDVVGADIRDGRIDAIHSEAAARTRAHRARAYVLATGGILGGGIITDHLGRVKESIFDLPLAVPHSRSEWFKNDYFDRAGHPISQAGLAVDNRFRPTGEASIPTLVNLHAAGGILANCDALRERSHEGVAVMTGYWAGEYAAKNGSAQTG